MEQVVSGAKLEFKWMINPFHDRWFADPFILSVDGKEIKLLVEDYRYADNQGRISRVVVDIERQAIVSCKTVLKGNHYSFPAIFRKEGKVYVYPEQAHAGRLDLFEYDEVNETCKFLETLSTRPLADAIIYDGRIWATEGEQMNGKRLASRKFQVSGFKFQEGETQKFQVSGFKFQESDSGEFQVSSSKFQEGESEEFQVSSSKSQECGLEDYRVLKPETRNSKLSSSPDDEYLFDECIARNAGDFFVCNGKIYRPAQECNRWYGNALSLQLYENNEFQEIRRIPGLHTMNTHQGVTVVDRKIFPLKWIYLLTNHSDL